MMDKKGKSLIVRWGPVMIWMGVIFFASSLAQRPSTPGLETFDFDDKIQHGSAYAVLAALVWRALDSRVGWERILLAIGFSIVYGFTDEYHQCFTPGRECSMADVVSDTIGAAAAVIVLTIWTGGDYFGKRAGRTGTGKSIRGKGQKTGER